MKIINKEKSKFVRVGDLKSGDTFLYRGELHVIADIETSNAVFNITLYPDFIIAVNLAGNRIYCLATWINVERCGAYVTVTEEANREIDIGLYIDGKLVTSNKSTKG